MKKDITTGDTGRFAETGKDIMVISPSFEDNGFDMGGQCNGKGRGRYEAPSGGGTRRYNLGGGI